MYTASLPKYVLEALVDRLSSHGAELGRVPAAARLLAVERDLGAGRRVLLEQLLELLRCDLRVARRRTRSVIFTADSGRSTLPALSRSGIRARR
jgi:hypothetical protein